MNTRNTITNINPNCAGGYYGIEETENRKQIKECCDEYLVGHDHEKIDKIRYL